MEFPVYKPKGVVLESNKWCQRSYASNSCFCPPRKILFLSRDASPEQFSFTFSSSYSIKNCEQRGRGSRRYVRTYKSFRLGRSYAPVRRHFLKINTIIMAMSLCVPAISQLSNMYLPITASSPSISDACMGIM